MKLEKFVEGVIRENKIKTQTELVKYLEQSGIAVTQSNLSRVLKKIHAIKITDNEQNSFYSIQDRPLEAEGWIRNLVFSIQDNGYNIVIKTYIGGAEIVGKVIDELDLENILGTVGGTDVVIIVPKDVSKINKLKKELEDFLS
jgi:transcriptional regulator of arginine metabolism